MQNSFQIYNASAGAGKTFALVKEYLCLLFKSKKKDTYKKILAITFTNKAVNEMKLRIIESLRDFSLSQTPKRSLPLFKEVKNATGLNTESLKQKSAQLLKNIIHNYAAFEVSTIDGFTHRILRTFAKDLGIPVNFEVELNTHKILLEAVESLISKAGTNKQLTQTLVTFALSKADEDKSWDITRDLFNISKLLTNENNQLPLQLLKNKTMADFKKFRQELKKEVEKAQESIQDKTDVFFQLIEDNGLTAADFKGKYFPNHFKKLKANLKISSFDSQWMANLESDPLYKKTFKDEAKKQILDSLQPQLVSLFKLTKKAYFKIEFLKEINKRSVQLSLLNAISQEVENIKKERSLVLISEFNPKISAQVKDQPAPFIYERLGERYQHYFIDEFQDTSQMQWENLIPLIDNRLSGQAEDESSSLMLVGDAKQSIYRWRGGKAEQFIELYNGSTPFSIEKTTLNLPNNYRSGEEIVNFNNQLFSYASRFLGNPEYEQLYKKSEQAPKKTNFGYVDISFINAENKAEEDELYPKKVLDIILSLEEKGYSKGDICILTRKKTEGIAIANFLSEEGIALVSSETLLINNSENVNFIVNLLAFSLNPEDQLLKLAIFDYLQKNILKLANPHEAILNSLEKDGRDFFHFLEGLQLSFRLETLRSLSPYEAAEYCIRSFSLIKKSDAYLQFFLDFIFENTQKEAAGLQEFLDIWQEEKASLSISVPKDEDAVQIMTIHKAKGLEFPVVIYPYANSDFKDTKQDELWLELEKNSETIPVSYISASQKMLNWGERPAALYQDLLFKKELDTLNVLYVACTRAVNQLYILSKLDLESKTGNEKQHKTSGLLIGFLKHLGVWNTSNHFQFGKIGEPEKRTKETSRNRYFERFYSSATQNQAVSIVTRSGSLWDTKQQHAIEKGEIAHEVLAAVHTYKDIEPALENAINDGLIEKSSRENLQALLLRITSHEQLKKFYQQGVKNYNERDIILPSGEILRPDRLNFEGNSVNVIDYKTGKPEEKHRTQIKKYAQALENMGFKVKASLLVYMNKELSIKAE